MENILENYIKNLIEEKCPGFSQKHENTDELIKQYEPEILSVFNDIANIIIESAEES
jgi:hypothetical protein